MNYFPYFFYLSSKVIETEEPSYEPPLNDGITWLKSDIIRSQIETYLAYQSQVLDTP